MARPHPLLLLGLGLAGGCLPQAEPQAPLASPAAIGAAWSAVQPDGLVELVLSPADALPQDDGCPVVDLVDGVETWSGGCVTLDGTVVEGSLQRFDGPDGAWVAGERFAVLDADGLQLYLDGAVELRGQGELILLDAAATTCGAHVDCQDGLVSLDLRYSLRLDQDRVADAAVRGFVALDEGDPTAVEGAWRVAPETCELEPTDGLFAAQLDQRQALELDGDVACDGCAAWTVQGQVAPPWCPAVL
ncbi:hypothetical protein L6R53_02080 [Myxococcota bacterium]|nr:hypothetical protein [Myxococcota bacterium]